MPTLYELTKDYQYLYSLLSAGDIDEQAFNDSMESMMFNEEFEQKAENYAKIIRMLEHDAQASEAEKLRLDKRSKAFSMNECQVS